MARGWRLTGSSMKKPSLGDEGSSQSSRILAHLQIGHTLTPMDALNLFGCWSLSQRIKDLRYRGHRIITTMVSDEVTGKRYAQYHLEQSAQ
jgi:Helix-turn-helix domain